MNLSIEYAVQTNPKGIAEAFLIGNGVHRRRPRRSVTWRQFFSNSKQVTEQIGSDIPGCRVFAVRVANPEAYGVLQFGDQGELIDILEKPKLPPSPFIIPGLYIFDRFVAEHTKGLKPSLRGELEITDLIRIYLQRGDLEVRYIDNYADWFDMGTHESLFQASKHVRAIRQTESAKESKLCPRSLT